MTVAAYCVSVTVSVTVILHVNYLVLCFSFLIALCMHRMQSAILLWHFCLSVCLSAYLSVCQSVCLSVCLSNAGIVS